MGVWTLPTRASAKSFRIQRPQRVTIQFETGDPALGQLTPAQITTLCHEVESFSMRSGLEADVKEITCRQNATVGILDAADMSKTDAELRAECRANYDLCQSSSTSTYQCRTVCTTNSGTCDQTPDPACTATVNEYSACINDVFRSTTISLMQLPPCDAVTVAMLRQDLPTPADVPQSCQTLSQKCASPPKP